MGNTPSGGTTFSTYKFMSEIFPATPTVPTDEGSTVQLDEISPISEQQILTPEQQLIRNNKIVVFFENPDPYLNVNGTLTLDGIKIMHDLGMYTKITPMGTLNANLLMEL